jgi:hypothetical protein
MVPPTIFFVTSHGLAGDHWFDWFSRALNAHPDIYVYMGESVRAKYFKERSRKERPDPEKYVEFLRDMGAAYPVVGETYAYRSYQLEHLPNDIRRINVTRHPYCWLGHYVDWRVSGMNYPPAVDHEWDVVDHDLYRNLKPYTREDVEEWAFFRGLTILNRMTSDLRVENVKIESIIENRDVFEEVFRFLTEGGLTYHAKSMEALAKLRFTAWRKGTEIRRSPSYERKSWPAWKNEAWDAIIKPETLDLFAHHGYVL